MKKIIALSIAFLSSASVAHAAVAGIGPVGATGDVSAAVLLVVRYLNLAIQFFTVAAVAFVIWNGFKFVMSAGDEEKRGEARSGIIYGLIGIAVMLSVYGLVNLITSSTGVSGTATVLPVPGV